MGGFIPGAVKAGLQSKKFVPVATPLSPLSTTSATLTEAFAPGLHSTATPYLYSDSGGSFTTPATLGGKVGSVKAMGGRSETLVQATAANQYSWLTEPNSGNPSIGNLAISPITGMIRSYSGPVGTVLIVLAPYYKALFASATQYIFLTNLTSNTPTHYCRMTRSTSPAYDGLTFSGYQSDSSVISNAISPQLGSPDVLLWRADQTNGNTVLRSGQQLGTAAARTLGPLTGTGYACLGNTISSAGVMSTTGLHFLGYILGFFTWSGPLSTAEAQGVSAWAQANLTKQQQSYEGDHVVIGFYGNGTVDSESSAALAPFMARTGDHVHWNQVPINCPMLMSGQRDWGLCYDPVTSGIYAVSTGANGHFYLWSMLDKVNLNSVGTVDVSALTTTTSNVWAPEFVKNADGSLWLDGAGLPRIVFCYTIGSSTNFQIAFIKPIDSTWKTGGAWNAPTTITWTTNPGSMIDPSIVLNNAPGGDGLFHMVAAINTGGSAATSYINHSTASSLDGAWTAQGAQDAFGLGGNLEGPQLNYRASDNSWILQIDKQGGQGLYARSTGGIGGPYSATAGLAAPFVPEQWNLQAVPQGF